MTCPCALPLLRTAWASRTWWTLTWSAPELPAQETSHPQPCHRQQSFSTGAVLLQGCLAISFLFSQPWGGGAAGFLLRC